MKRNFRNWASIFVVDDVISGVGLGLFG